jgi:hypothetical protein
LFYDGRRLDGIAVPISHPSTPPSPGDGAKRAPEFCLYLEAASEEVNSEFTNVIKGKINKQKLLRRI